MMEVQSVSPTMVLLFVGIVTVSIVGLTAITLMLSVSLSMCVQDIKELRADIEYLRTKGHS